MLFPSLIQQTLKPTAQKSRAPDTLRDVWSKGRSVQIILLTLRIFYS